MKENQPRAVHVVSCAPGQVVRLKLGPGIDPAAPIGRFFEAGDIDIMVGHGRGENVRLVVSAPVDFEVSRDRVRY